MVIVELIPVYDDAFLEGFPLEWCGGIQSHFSANLDVHFEIAVYCSIKDGNVQCSMFNVKFAVSSLMNMSGSELKM